MVRGLEVSLLSQNAILINSCWGPFAAADAEDHLYPRNTLITLVNSENC
jgi:hypothetical protein